MIDYSDIEPPNHFTQLNIIPKLEDILTNETEHFLRKNLTNGAYKNVDHYLDVQFRLLREDFFKPLRDGVQKLRQIVEEARFDNRLTLKNTNKQNEQLNKDVVKRIRKIESLSVYFDCSIEQSIPVELGIVYQVKLSDEKTKPVNWDVSKKLLFGSLVCLSNDFFESNCLIGSICERDTEKLKKGIVYIKFNIDAENDLNQNVTMGQRFIMLETSAFFESYKYVLQALVSFQRDGEENFPFKENLVYCQNQDMMMPKYLTNVPFDFRFLDLFYFSLFQLTLEIFFIRFAEILSRLCYLKL